MNIYATFSRILTSSHALAHDILSRTPSSFATLFLNRSSPVSPAPSRCCIRCTSSQLVCLLSLPASVIPFGPFVVAIFSFGPYSWGSRWCSLASMGCTFHFCPNNDMSLGTAIELRLLSTETLLKLPLRRLILIVRNVCMSVARFNLPARIVGTATDCICNEVTRNHPITRLVSCGSAPGLSVHFHAVGIADLCQLRCCRLEYDARITKCSSVIAIEHFCREPLLIILVKDLITHGTVGRVKLSAKYNR